MIGKRYLGILLVAVVSISLGLFYNSITFAGKPTPQPSSTEVTNLPIDNQGNSEAKKHKQAKIWQTVAVYNITELVQETPIFSIVSHDWRIKYVSLFDGSGSMTSPVLFEVWNEAEFFIESRDIFHHLFVPGILYLHGMDSYYIKLIRNVPIEGNWWLNLIIESYDYP